MGTSNLHPSISNDDQKESRHYTYEGDQYRKYHTENSTPLRSEIIFSGIAHPKVGINDAGGYAGERPRDDQPGSYPEGVCFWEPL